LRRLGAFEHDGRAADLNLIAHVQLALVDARAVHHRARLVAEIDERDVVGPGDLDDRVHAGGELVVHLQVALRVFADFDDVLRHGLATRELTTLIERERQNSLCHCLVFLGCGRRPR
jgi:hypothetical protein